MSDMNQENKKKEEAYSEKKEEHTDLRNEELEQKKEILDGEKLILNMVNFAVLFQKEFSDLIPDLDTFGMTPQHSKMLHEIHFQGCTTSKKLAENLHISIPNASRSLNVLYRLGYIEKRSCSKDKRVYYITLSPFGLKRMQEALYENQQEYFQKLNKLKAEELEELILHFTRIKELFMKLNRKD